MVNGTPVYVIKNHSIKTGHGPNSSQLIVICVVICVGLCCYLCCSVYCLCVNVYRTTATGCQPSCS